MTSVARPASTSDPAGPEGSASTFVTRGYPWGTLSAEYADGAEGFRYLLTVFPPGTTIEQRRALMFRRQWLTWGAIFGFLIASALSVIIDGWTAIVIGVVVYVGTLWVADAIAGTVRHRVVELHAQTLNHTSEPFQDCDKLDSVASRLLELDEIANEGQLNAVEYEARWGEIYREVECDVTEKYRKSGRIR